jgi:hypothetical protein
MRSVAEIGFAVLFSVGAVFNGVYTLGHADEFYGGWADSAWFAWARDLLRDQVVPHGVAVTVGVIGCQLAIAALIFSRSELLVVGLAGGGVFAAGAAMFSSPGGFAANLMLAFAQFALAFTR